MCSTPDAPKPPPVAPEAPVMPVAPTRSNGDSDRRRRAAALNSSTILTGSRGVTDNAAIATKTLLGQ